MGVGDIMAKRNSYKKSNKSVSNVKKKSQINNKFEEKKKNQIADVYEDDLKKTKFEKKIYDDKNYKSKTVKMARRDLIYSSNDSNDEMSKLLKIVLIVTGVMIVFYGVTTFVTKKVNAVKTAKLGKSSEKATIQYDSIIIGSMFKFDGNYYVLIEKEDDENSSEYDTIIKSIDANDDAPKVYKADLSSSFNKNYYNKESNYNSDLTKFKVSNTTLVEVKDHKIENTFDSYDSIKKKLDELK